MKQAKDKENGKILKIPSKALIMDNETKTGAQKSVLLKFYDPKKDTFSLDIQKEEEKSLDDLPNMYILYDSINPSIFFKRISEPIKLRKKRRKNKIYILFEKDSKI